MKTFVCLFTLFFGLIATSFGQFGNPFVVQVRLVGDEVKVEVTVPSKHYLYADYFTVTDALGNEQKAITVGDITTITDPNSGKPKSVFSESFTAAFKWVPKKGAAGSIHVKYWGCNDRVCFIPQTKVVDLVATASGSKGGTVDRGSAD